MAVRLRQFLPVCAAEYAELQQNCSGAMVSAINKQFSLAKASASGNNVTMIIGDRLRALREDKKLSQGDIEKRTGLLRCYISRVENGHTVPAIETLEKLARALE